MKGDSKANLMKNSKEKDTLSIKSVFERRKETFLHSLETVLAKSGADKYISQMFRDENSALYIPDRLCELIERYLTDDREDYISDLYRRIRVFEACFGESKLYKVEEIGSKILKEIDNGSRNIDKIRFLRTKLPVPELGPNSLIVHKSNMIELKQAIIENSTMVSMMRLETQKLISMNKKNLENVKKTVMKLPIFNCTNKDEKILKYKSYLKQMKQVYSESLKREDELKEELEKTKNFGGKIEIKELEDKIQGMSEKYKQVLAKKNDQISKLKESLRNVTENYNETVCKLSLSNADKEVLNAKLGKIVELESIIEERDRQVDDLRNEALLNKKSFEDAELEKEVLSQEISEIKELANSLKSSLDLKEKEISTATQTINNLSQQNSDFSFKHEEDQTEINTLKEENNSLREDLLQKSQEYNSLTQTQETMTKIGEKYIDIKEKYSFLKKEYKTLLKSVQEKEKSMQDLFSHASSLRAKVEARKEDKNKLEELQKKEKDYKMRIQELEDSLEVSKSQYNTVCKHYTALSKESSNAAERISIAEASSKAANVMQNDILRYEQETESAKQELAHLKLIVSEQKTKILRLEDSLRKAEMKVESSQDECAAEIKNNGKISKKLEKSKRKEQEQKKQIEQAEELLQRLKEETETAKTILANESKKNTSLEKSVKELNAIKSEQNEQIISLEEKLRTAKSELEKLQTKYELEVKQNKNNAGIAEEKDKMEKEAAEKREETLLQQIKELQESLNDMSSKVQQQFSELTETTQKVKNYEQLLKLGQGEESLNEAIDKIRLFRSIVNELMEIFALEDEEEIIERCKILKQVSESIMSQFKKCSSEAELPRIVQSIVATIRSACEMLEINEEAQILPAISDCINKYKNLVAIIGGNDPEQSAKWYVQLKDEVIKLGNSSDAFQNLRNIAAKLKAYEVEKSDILFVLEKEYGRNAVECVRKVKRDIQVVTDALLSVTRVFSKRVLQNNDFDISFPIDEILRNKIFVFVKKLDDYIENTYHINKSILQDARSNQYEGSDVLEAVEFICQSREEKIREICQEKSDKEKEDLQSNADMIAYNLECEKEKLRGRVGELSQLLQKEKDESSEREKKMFSELAEAKKAAKNAKIDVERELRIRGELIRIIEKKPADSDFLRAHLSSKEVNSIQKANSSMQN